MNGTRPFGRGAAEPVVYYALLVSIAGAALLLGYVATGVEVPFHSPAYWALAGALIAAELFPVRLPRRKQDITLTASTPFALALVVIWGIGPALLVQALGVLIGELVRRSPGLKTAFNVSQASLIVAITGYVHYLVETRQIGPTDHLQLRDMVSIAVPAAVQLFLNGLLAPTAAALAQRARVVPFLVEHARRWMAVEALPLALAPLAIAAVHVQPFLIPLTLLPVVVVRLLGTEAMKHQASEARFEALLEGAPEAILVLDAEGRVTLGNVLAERVFLYSREDLLGMAVGDLFAGESRAAICETLDGAPRPSEHQPGTYDRPRHALAVRAGGETFPAALVVSRAGSESAPVTVVSVRDLTEQERARREREALEKRVQDSERLETVGRLSGGVAHDFNNLLAVVLNCAAFIEDESEGRVKEDAREIRLAAERGAALTRQLLIFSRRDATSPDVLDAGAVTREAEGLLRRALGEQIELRMSVQPALPRVLLTRSHLEQALLNLAVNARDALRHGGTFDVELAAVVRDPDGEGPRSWLRLSVWDDGPGMSEDVAARVFEPFFTTKPLGEGTGLGLATLHGIVARADGEVQLYTRPGAGTRFDIFLPAVADPSKPPPADEPSSAPGGSGERILLVEDEASVRAVTERVLQDAGYEVVATSNAAQALALLDTTPGDVDLVLTDVVMPGLSGPDLVARITEQHPDMPVVFMSGYSEELMAPHGVPERARLLRKPFGASELRSAVREALDRTRSPLRD